MAAKGNRLKGKVALITGASGGQGAVEAQMFAREGASVVLADIDHAAGKALAAKIRKAGGKALYLSLDVTDAGQWSKAIARVRREFGALHVLVNNAGIVSRVGIMDVGIEDWVRTIDINLTGPLLGMRAAAPLIRDSGGGSIVNISSTAAIAGHWGAAYVASKWGIRANSVHPAQVDETKMTDSSAPGYREANERVIPLGRAAKPEEIGHAVLFLASDESSYINGTEIVVDCGYTSFALARVRKQLQKEYATGPKSKRR